MTSDPVAIVDYDPRWPLLYKEERARIFKVIGQKVPAMEHIGSTAVPGLGTKPIIDIMIGLARLGDATECIEALEGLGYRYVPEFETSIPDRRFFYRRRRGRGYHLHVVEDGSQFWVRHLLFRDYLRSHPGVAREYHRLKLNFAATYGSDREGYTEAKTPFIRSVEKRAREEGCFEGGEEPQATGDL